MRNKVSSVQFKQPPADSTVAITIISRTGETIRINGIEQKATFEAIRDALADLPIFGENEVRDMQ